MAPPAHLAKRLAHIAACHSASLPGRRLKLWAGDEHIGYVLPELAGQLAALSRGVTLAQGHARMAPELLPELNALAGAAGMTPRGEDFDVRATVDGPVLGVLDRGALPSFGVIGVGVHLNGLVRRAGWHVWVAKRAANKKLDPGRLDNLVAGGVSAGFTPLATLLKEAQEEASLPASLASQARLVARFCYAMERPEGLRRDVVFAYDLELPESFIPTPADDEVECFTLMRLAEVLERLSSGDDFKFNVNLVLIDLCIRFGLLTGAHAAELRAALAKGWSETGA